MSDEIEEIKRRIDIVDLVSSYLTLKKAGTSFKALCPFHQEKTPSFMVNPERQIFKCFGCGESGDIFSFVMKMENLEFMDALKLLADKAGVTLQRLDREEYKEHKEEKTKIYEINKIAAQFFHKILLGKDKAQFVRDYLKDRQINQKSVEEFLIGYAPDVPNILSNFLQSKDYSMLDINKAGLNIKSDRKAGEYYDRFRDRLMFPIFDVMGNVIAFTGRAMHETESGKYVNSPETPIFSKSQVLYGLNKAKQAIKQKNQVIIVEGQTDVISCHQRGYQNVVASSGTALTPFQLEILSRFTKNLAFALDQDKAGEIATKRAIDLANQQGFDVKIILIPKGKDPDECLKENPKLWEQAVKGQKGVLDYYFEITLSKEPGKLDATAKRNITKELLPAIKNLSDSIIQAHYIQKLSEILNVPEKFLYEALEKVKTNVIKTLSKPNSEIKKSETTVEERLLGLVLAHKEFQAEYFKKINPKDCENLEVKTIAQELQKYYNQNAEFKLENFKKKIPQYSTKVDLWVFPFENVTDLELLQKEFDEYVGRTSASKTEKIKKHYEEKIKDAEKEGDKDKVKKLIGEFQTEIIKK